MNQIFGLGGLVDWADFVKLLGRLVFDLVFATFIIHFVYFRLYQNREHVLTCFVFNIVTFLLCSVLRKVPAEIGFALALFGVFGILRYRTEQIRIRDLTYLFMLIGVGILNAVANEDVSLLELLLGNVAIAGVTALLELGPFQSSESATPLLYDRLDLLAPERRSELLSDLAGRTGLPVSRVEVLRIDLLRDAAEITIFHRGRR